MTSRRNFLKKSGLFGSALMMPGFNRLEQLTKTGKSASNGRKPLIISTWRHGLAANERAWEVLHQTGSILDAVEEGVKITEVDLDNRSVGLNGYPDREGIVTLDASIMDGKSGDCGSVCFLRQVKHPITLARMVMEETPHVMLAGEGARQFAMEMGVPLEEEILHPDAEKEYLKWLEEREYRPVINIENHDTIGMVGVDSEGNLAGTCTTSGLAFKMHGRVGDSPIIGAGLYVDNEVGAATATGLGETIIKVCGSFLVVELMRQGRSPQQACEEAVNRLIEKNSENIEDMQAGFIAVNKEGEYGGYAVHPGFDFAVHHQDGNILEDSKSHFTNS
ncbi:MAG: glycosylasparaginase [Balneolaceae bacterium]|nr:MAG: glycosylasparaginase [Balneolaceae bacterium]